ncbi:Anti-sigma F factor antagonist [anaerobic digester metagenome]
MCTILSPAGDTLTVLLAGEIDHHSAAGMRAQIDEAIERYRPAVLTLDFGGVTFMDSSGIGLVMGRYKLMNTFGGTVNVVNTPKPLQKVMRLAGLDRLARIENGGIKP